MSCIYQEIERQDADTRRPETGARSDQSRVRASAPANTADRLLSVLGGFTLERPVQTVAGIAAELGVSLGSAYRYVKSLQRAGLLDALHGEGVVLGPAIIEFDYLIRRTDPLLHAAEPVMRTLAEQMGGRVLLCRTYRDRVVCLHEEAGADAPVNVSYRRGHAMPLVRGATSKIILAHLPARTVRRMATEHSAEFRAAGLPGNWEALQIELRALRRAKVCISRGDVDKGILGVAAALHDGKRVVGSLSIALRSKAVSAPRLARLKVHLAAAVAECESALAELPEVDRSPRTKQ